MSKRESIEEFLQRGGTITKVAPQEEPEEGRLTSASKSSASQMMSLAEGSIYYAESKARIKAVKKEQPIDLKALPASLLKFITKNEEN